MTKEPAFSSRYYSIIAKALQPHVILHTEIMALVVADLIETFKNDNPRFDQKLFLRECGFQN